LLIKPPPPFPNDEKSNFSMKRKKNSFYAYKASLMVHSGWLFLDAHEISKFWARLAIYALLVIRKGFGWDR